MQEIIAVEPSSEIKNAYEAHLQEQEIDEDIHWIKELMMKHKDDRQKFGKIINKVRKCLFKEYSNLRILDGIVYRLTEDICGFNRMQYVLPKQIVSKVLDKIHKTVYSGHLGKRKTYRKVQERFYRPELKQEVCDYGKTCDICQIIKLRIPKRSELIPITPTEQISWYQPIIRTI